MSSGVMMFLVTVIVIIIALVMMTPEKPTCPAGSTAKYQRGWLCVVPPVRP